MADEKTLQKHLAELRSKSLRAANGSEQKIRKLYKSLLKELQGFIATEYAEYAQEGKLSYSILQQKGEYARFMHEVTQRLDGITPDMVEETQRVVDEIYELNYKGMIDAVSDAKELKSIKATLPEVAKRSVENKTFDDPRKLVLKEALEYNRQGIIYNIKKSVSLGLVQGDRYDEIAKRIVNSLDGDYKKAIRIARTETHRVQEQGLNDAAMDCSDALNHSKSGLIMVKIWRTGQDSRVRDTHAEMEGVTVLTDEEFELNNGTTLTPGSSGIASEDINCRCYCSYKLMTAEEYEKATGKVYSKKITDYGKTDTSDRKENDSLSKYTDKDGNLTPERELLHQSIIDKHFRGIKKPEGQPVFTVMGGGSAAGKSTMINKGAATLPKGSVMVDSDAIKSMLPEYDGFIKAGKVSKAAAYVHEESSALAKRIMSIANKGGFNVVLDGTGDGSVSSLTKKIMNARKAGLRVEGVYATVPTDVAVKRSMARAKKTGREVPLEIIKGTHRNVSKVLPQCAELFDDVKLFDTTDGAVLIATGGNGKKLTAVKGMEGKLTEFLKKADE